MFRAALRMRALTNSSHFLGNASGIPSNTDAATEASEGYTGLTQMAYRVFRNQDVHPQSQRLTEAGNSRYGSVLRDRAEFHLRQRTGSPTHNMETFSNRAPSPSRHPNFVPIVTHMADSDDEPLQFVSQITQEGQSLRNRRTPSPPVELSFDFFASPTRTVEAHSTSLNEESWKELVDENPEHSI